MLVLVHEQPYRAEATLFQPCHDQGCVPSLIAHTSPNNWTFGVKRSWTWCELPGVSAPLVRIFLCVKKVISWRLLRADSLALRITNGCWTDNTLISKCCVSARKV